ncbi:MAG: hypothetical protein JSV44_05115 [Candidatus Zixiibacteriota bacterium]|nr:MAG: hypothetical protein JSV44_05115 [candidate division Zixibacteria bacterium]
MRRRGLLAAILCLTFLGARASDLNPDSLFTAASTHYEKMEFARALADFQQLEKTGYVSASLYFNIGNCYFKQEQLGYAILYYYRARRIDPTDDDIASNLAFARQFMAVSLEGIKINPVTSFMDSIISPFTLDLLAWTASAVFIALLLFFSAIVYFRFTGMFIRLTGYMLIMLLLAVSIMTTYKYRTDFMAERGVVVAEEAGVYSGPGADHDLEFVGSYGLTFELERVEGDFYLVIFENKRKGWIEQNLVELI